jgi:hypothetical protein
MDLGRHAEQGLHVMADLVGYHVGLGEIAGGGEAGLHLAEERQVEIHLPIAGTVEGADGGIGEAAGRAHAAAEEDQLGVLVLLAGGLEDGAPGVLGVAEHGADELALRVVGRRRALLLHRSALLHALVDHVAEDGQWVLAHHQTDHHDDGDAAQAQALAAAEAHAAPAAAGVHHVVAASTSLPAHGRAPSVRRGCQCRRRGGSAPASGHFAG